LRLFGHQVLDFLRVLLNEEAWANLAGFDSEDDLQLGQNEKEVTADELFVFDKDLRTAFRLLVVNVFGFLLLNLSYVAFKVILDLPLKTC